MITLFHEGTAVEQPFKPIYVDHSLDWSSPGRCKGLPLKYCSTMKAHFPDGAFKDIDCDTCTKMKTIKIPTVWKNGEKVPGTGIEYAVDDNGQPIEKDIIPKYVEVESAELKSIKGKLNNLENTDYNLENTVYDLENTVYDLMNIVAKAIENNNKLWSPYLGLGKDGEVKIIALDDASSAIDGHKKRIETHEGKIEDLENLLSPYTGVVDGEEKMIALEDASKGIATNEEKIGANEEQIKTLADVLGLDDQHVLKKNTGKDNVMRAIKRLSLMIKKLEIDNKQE